MISMLNIASLSDMFKPVLLVLILGTSSYTIIVSGLLVFRY